MIRMLLVSEAVWVEKPSARNMNYLTLSFHAWWAITYHGPVWCLPNHRLVFCVVLSSCWCLCRNRYWELAYFSRVDCGLILAILKATLTCLHWCSCGQTQTDTMPAYIMEKSAHSQGSFLQWHGGTAGLIVSYYDHDKTNLSVNKLGKDRICIYCQP